MAVDYNLILSIARRKKESHKVDTTERMSIDEAIGLLVDMRFDDFDGVYTFSDKENTAMWMGQRALQICKDRGYSIWEG